MGIRTRKEALSRIPVDKAAYIEMEVEHSNDTSGKIRAPNQKTIDINSIKMFSNTQQRQLKDLRLEAYKKV